MAFGFGGLLGGGAVPDVQMPDGLPVSGGQGSPLVDAFLALQARRIQDAVTAPRDAYTGDLQVMGPDGHPTAEAMDRANGMAGLAMTGSMPLKAPKGALRMFGGGEAHDDPLASLEAMLADFKPEAPPPGPRLVDPAAKSWDLYHGSGAGSDFKRFDPNAGSNPAERGAVFFAPDGETASNYAGSAAGGTQAGAEAGPRVFRTTVEPGRTGVFDLSHLAETDPAFNARAREITVGQNPGNAGEFDRFMGSWRERRAADQEAARQAAEMGYPVYPDPTSNVSFGYGHIGAAIERAKADGLDTAILRGLAEHGGDDQVVALTPGRVRSYYDPNQLLYSGGPAGAAAGLPALTSSSDPKGQPVSAGLQMPSLGDLSPEMQAQIMQMLQQGPQAQSAPSPVDSLLFDRRSMGPSQTFAGADGSQGSETKEPAATGSVPRAAPPIAMSEVATQQLERQQASPADLSALGAPAAPPRIASPVQPPSNAPGQVSAQLPSQVSPTPSAPAADNSPGFMSRLSDPRVYNTLLGIGSGILQGRTFGEGLGQGIENAQRMNVQQGATDLQQLKLQREQAALGGNAAILKRAYPNLSDAELAAMATNSSTVTTALQILRDPTHGMPKTPEQMQAEARAQAAGTMEGGAKPLDRLQSEAQAQAAGTMAGNAKPLDRIEAEAKAQAAGAAAGKPDDDEGAKLAAQIEVRRQKATGLGLVEGSPAWQSFVGTGKIGRDQEMSATDKKAINSAEDELPVLAQTIDTLKRAKELNNQTFTGITAGIRGKIGTSVPGASLFLDPKASEATREFNQLMSMEAIKSMSSTLKGATTDAEMNRFMDILGDPSTPAEIRARTLDRMHTLALRQEQIAKARVNDLRGGTYYKKGGGAPDQTDDQGGAPAPVTGAKRMRFDPTTGGFN